MKTKLLLLALPALLYSQTLPQLLEAAHENKTVQSAKHTLSAAAKRNDAVESAYLPSITLGINAQNVLKETPALAKNSLKGELSLRYTLYDGGKRESLYELYSSGVDAQKKSLEALRQAISLDVTTLYFDYLSTVAGTKSLQSQIDQLEAQYKRLQEFVTIGAATKDELLKIDSSLKKS